MAQAATPEAGETLAPAKDQADNYRELDELPGGQCQRIGIARALILRPRLLVRDEPVSAPEVSGQAQVVSLLRGLRRELGIAMILIAHDLSVGRHISDRILVMIWGGRGPAIGRPGQGEAGCRAFPRRGRRMGRRDRVAGARGAEDQ